MKHIMLVGITVLAAWTADAAAPQEEFLKVTMEGRAPGKDKSARNEAILNAEREIVLQAIEAILPKPDRAVIKTVLDRAPSYIVPSPRLMKCDQEHDSIRVEIEAEVRNERLRADLARCVLPHLQPPRKLLAIIAEQSTSDESVSVAKAGAPETAITEALHNTSLEMIDSTAVRSEYTEAELLERINGEPQKLAQLARENLADVIVAGAATFTHDTPSGGSNVQPCRALIIIRIVRATDGALVDSRAVDAVVNSLDRKEGDAQALEDVSAKLKKEITVPAILAAAGAVPADDVMITVTGSVPGDMVNELLQALRDRPGVELAETLLVTPRLARIRVKYSGPMDALVDYLTERKYAGGRLEPKRIVGRQMDLDIAAR